MHISSLPHLPFICFAGWHRVWPFSLRGCHCCPCLRATAARDPDEAIGGGSPSSDDMRKPPRKGVNVPAVHAWRGVGCCRAAHRILWNGTTAVSLYPAHPNDSMTTPPQKRAKFTANKRTDCGFCYCSLGRLWKGKCVYNILPRTTFSQAGRCSLLTFRAEKFYQQ